MFYHKSAFLLRAGFDKMAAFASFQRHAFKGEFLPESYHSECPARHVLRASQTGFHVGQVSSILLRWVLDQNFQVLGDGLYLQIVKYCILSEVCMIKTVPHSTVSPQMWCTNGKKVGFHSPRFVGKILQSKLVKRKKFGLIFFPGLTVIKSLPIVALKCDRRWLLFFGGTYEAVNLM